MVRASDECGSMKQAAVAGLGNVREPGGTRGKVRVDRQPGAERV